MIVGFIASAINAVERTTIPDTATRYGIGVLVGRTRRRLAKIGSLNEKRFAGDMAGYSIAEHTAAANEQHYEMPPEFFALTLGPNRKYSCCLYPNGNETLAEAEIAALEETVDHAGLRDGQSILELGCGWGPLTLFMAQRFPAGRIVAVSNSVPQRLHIQADAAARGLTNVEVVTADMNDFELQARFDRVVSVEMFEHMSNWRDLLTRIRTWLTPEGRLFIHVFSHRQSPYRFDHRDDADWIAKHFFTGGIMPSHGLIGHFPDCFAFECDWRWNGMHYARTARDWLTRFDENRDRIDAMLADVYGPDAELWRRRWRLFYLATEGLFGHAEGRQWGVSHYLLSPTG